MNNALKQALKHAEVHWPYPLALTCRALRVKSRWEDALGAACHLFELMLRHAFALVLVEYGQLKYPSQRIASYLMARAYRGRLTCGSMIEGLREVVPYLAGYRDLLHMPALVDALLDALQNDLLDPLNQWRIQWSHPKGHVAYMAPQASDYADFSLKLEALIQRLHCFGDYTLLYTQQLTRTAQGWDQSALLLQGAMQPFETVHYPLPLDSTPPESHSVVLALPSEAPQTTQLLPLTPFYMARSDASGQCELAALIHLRKKRCVWDPEWPADTEGASHNAYVAWMERFTLPEREPGCEPDSESGSELAPAPESESEPAPAPDSIGIAAPVFRNATWRMFAMDWALSATELHNHLHYDALTAGQQVLSVWRYVSEENAYLVGVRPRLADLQAPQAVQVLEGCPADYHKDFAPEHGGHWHHSHYRWYYLRDQDQLGAYLEQCDTRWRKPKGIL